MLFSKSIADLDSIRLTLKDSSEQVAIRYYYQIADWYKTNHQLRDSQFINIKRGIQLARKIADTLQLAEGMLDLGYYHINGKKL